MLKTRNWTIKPRSDQEVGAKKNIFIQLVASETWKQLLSHLRLEHTFQESICSVFSSGFVSTPCLLLHLSTGPQSLYVGQPLPWFPPVESAARGINYPNLNSPGDWLAVLGEENLFPEPKGTPLPILPNGTILNALYNSLLANKNRTLSTLLADSHTPHTGNIHPPVTVKVVGKGGGEEPSL